MCRRQVAASGQAEHDDDHKRTHPTLRLGLITDRRGSGGAAYLGKKDRFDESITDFSERYADQNDRDSGAFTDAIKSGRLHALEGV